MLRGQQPTDDDIRKAALQFVRKISGYQKPSKANHDAFERAVAEIAASTEKLLASVGAPKATA